MALLVVGLLSPCIWWGLSLDCLRRIVILPYLLSFPLLSGIRATRCRLSRNLEDESVAVETQQVLVKVLRFVNDTAANGMDSLEASRAFVSRTEVERLVSTFFPQATDWHCRRFSCSCLSCKWPSGDSGNVR